MATYIPGEYCVLRYLLTLKDSTSGQTRDVLVSGRVMPDQHAGADYTNTLLLPFHAQLYRSGWGSGR